MLRRGYFTPSAPPFRKKLRKNPFFRCKSRDFNPKRIPFRSFFSAGIPKRKRFATKNTNRRNFFVQHEFDYITVSNKSQVKKKICMFFARLVFTWNLHYDIIENIVCRRAVLCLSAANNVKFRGKRNRYEEKTKKFPYRREWNRNLRDSARSFVCG